MAKKDELNVKKIMSEFTESEKSLAKRKGSLNIDVPFEQAIKKILRPTPEQNRRAKRAKVRGKL